MSISPHNRNSFGYQIIRNAKISYEWEIITAVKKIDRDETLTVNRIGKIVNSLLASI